MIRLNEHADAHSPGYRELVILFDEQVFDEVFYHRSPSVVLALLPSHMDGADQDTFKSILRAVSTNQTQRRIDRVIMAATDVQQSAQVLHIMTEEFPTLLDEQRVFSVELRDSDSGRIVEALGRAAPVPAPDDPTTQERDNSPAPDVELMPAAGLRAAETLDGQTLFFGKDERLWVLQVADDREPKHLFEMSKNESGPLPIAVLPSSRRVIISDARTIWRIAPDGIVEEVARVENISLASDKSPLAEGNLQWFLRCSPDEKQLFFVYSVTDSRCYHVGRLNLDSFEATMIEAEFPADIDVDTQTGIAYIPSYDDLRGTPYIAARDFDGQVDRSYPVSRRYFTVRLSDCRRRLLMSTDDLNPKPTIAILDLDSGEKTILDSAVSNATWLADDAIAFVRGSTELWQYRLGAKEPEQLMATDQQGLDQYGSYAKAPAVSADKRWLSWQWYITDETGRIQRGTVLLDRKRGEYRHLRNCWWRDVAWMT